MSNFATVIGRLFWSTRQAERLVFVEREGYLHLRFPFLICQKYKLSVGPQSTGGVRMDFAYASDFAFMDGAPVTAPTLTETGAHQSPAAPTSTAGSGNGVVTEAAGSSAGGAAPAGTIESGKHCDNLLKAVRTAC